MHAATATTQAAVVEAGADMSARRLTAERRQFLIEHAGKDEWPLGKMAAQLGQPPVVVQGWLAQPDIGEAIQMRKHAAVTRAILGPNHDKPVVMTTIEPAAPRPADAPKLPLTVLIEDLDDSLLVALMRKLPASGEWSVLERDLWLDAFHACLALSVRLNGGA